MAPGSKANKKSTVDAAAWMFNVVTSVGIIIVNKALMATYGFSFATTLTGLHFATTTLMTLVLRCLGYIQPSHLPFTELLKFILFANFSIVGMNVSLMWNSVGFYQIAKLSMIPVACLLEVVFDKIRYSRDTKLSIGLVLVGVGVCTVTDVSVNTKGFVAAFVAVWSTALQQYYVHYLQRKYSLTSFNLLGHTAPAQAATLLIVGPFLDFWLTEKRVDMYDYNVVSLMFITLSCTIAIGTNLSQFICIGRFTAVSFQVLGHMKTILVLIMGFFSFDLGESFIEMAWWSETMSYCGWNERHVRNAKGKVEARYYLERKDGGVDLAVVGRVKSSSKRMSFRYALKKNHSVLKKLGSVEDVKGWLDSIVSGEMPHLADVPATTMTEQAAGGFNIRTSMSGKYQKPIHPTIDFSWMGSSWTCRKRRRHYPSFSRNGVKVSVNDFVYVLAEQNKRLVAYLEDLYEDSKGNKMVVVRWFHKTDEVGVVLSDETVDREIFFSLCLQDIKIECIDGLATVLSPQHYDKFLKLPMSVQLPPFFCQKIYGDDGLKPYDITQLQAYWRQEMLRYLNVSNIKSGEGAQTLGTDSATGASLVGCVGIRSKRRRSADGITDDCKASPDSVDVEALEASMCKEEKDGYYLKKGSLIEVLSQDSGIRGCWLKALIVKKHKDKVKVQYQDITDADDESKKLEEWILASRVADSDHLGLRTAGRKIVRPVLKPSNENNVWVVGVGMPVDVWWCDGWWEGIVVEKVSEEKFEVYLPGEKKISSFHRSDLRQSIEWSADEWVHINSRSDLVSSVLSLMKENEAEVKHDEKLSEVVVMSPKGEAKPTISLPVATSDKPSTKQPVPDLLKDVLVSALNWEPSKKRKRTASYCKHKPSATEGLSRERSLDCKKCSSMGDSLFSSSVVGWRKRNRIVSCCPHKPSLTDGFSCEKPLDCENGKFMGDSVFGSSVGQPLTGLVMSR